MGASARGIAVVLLCGALAGCAVAPSPTVAPSPGTTATPAPQGDAALILERIAIGACLADPQGGPALEDILAFDPDLMLWLGDNVYGDVRAVLGDMAGLRGLYSQLGGNERFQRLAATTTMMATWDDHDYGRNDAGAEWVFKRGAKREFLAFWGSGADDPRAAHDGVYSARTFGTGEHAVQVILLDNRFFRDPYGDDPALTLLGAAQWAWLRERLAEPARIRIIGSGIQVVNDYDHPSGAPWESWGDLPHERERLYALVRELRLPGVLIVSGDMHHAELTRHPDDAAGFGYPTYDLTGSGLDQQEGEQLPNPGRIGAILDSDRKFGSVTIDWTTDPADPAIHLRLHDGAAGVVHLEHQIRLSELVPP